MTFLWIVIVLMAIALAAEIFALVGLALVARDAGRAARATADELVERVRPATRVVQELSVFLKPPIEIVRNNSGEIASVLKTRACQVKATVEDAGQRLQRIRLRLQSRQTLEQWRDSERVIRGGIVGARSVGRAVRAVGAAIWLLRKVA